ncbi:MULTISPECIES: hypothetical protein [unclassified Thermosipho (in: thermotogales)]|nr:MULTISPECIES: hypothetical protein [unclassified Thermosipho (in: thermotogales)]
MLVSRKNCFSFVDCENIRSNFLDIFYKFVEKITIKTEDFLHKMMKRLLW